MKENSVLNLKTKNDNYPFPRDYVPLFHRVESQILHIRIQLKFSHI